MGGGKVPRAPDYEQRKVANDPVRGPMPVADDTSAQFKAGLYRSDDRTHTRDRELLVALGVDGSVPFERSARDADLPTMGQERGVKFASKSGYWRLISPANDNQKIAVAA